MANEERDTKPDLPAHPSDPFRPREVENPGDPGPDVLVPPEREEPRKDPKLPPGTDAPPGV